MVDFIDLGCGIGGSIGWAKARFGGDSHLGIDVEQKNVEQAIANGYSVVAADALDCDFQWPVSRYVSMLHFLEHIENELLVRKVIEKALQSATDFVFIKVPYFDKIDYLKNLGFRLTWTNWIGHPTAITTNLLRQIAQEFGVKAHIGYLYSVVDSQSSEIVPISAPVDTIYYDISLGDKLHVEFDQVYRETFCFLNCNCSYWDSLLSIDVH
jgi:hypothetical protein